MVLNLVVGLTGTLARKGVWVNCRRPHANGGLLSKPTELQFIKTPVPPVIRVPTPVPQVSDGSTVGTPLGELVDRKELDGLHSAVVIADGKPRRRSITDGSALG